MRFVAALTIARRMLDIDGIDSNHGQEFVVRRTDAFVTFLTDFVAQTEQGLAYVGHEPRRRFEWAETGTAFLAEKLDNDFAASGACRTAIMKRNQSVS